MIRLLRKTTKDPLCFQRFLSQTIHGRFAAAQKALNNLKEEPDNSEKLQIYALFKQATLGDAKTAGKTPGLFDMVGQAKYKAWNELQNMKKEEAMERYADIVKKLGGNFEECETHEVKEQREHEKKEAATEVKLDMSNRGLLKHYAYPRSQMLMTDSMKNMSTIEASISEDGIATVRLNRPNKGNAFNMAMWHEYKEMFASIRGDQRVKVVILTGNATHFSTGMDLEVFGEMQKMSEKETCEGRKREALTNLIQFLQDSVSAPEALCPVPVIAAISGYCIGGAVDVITACDLRYATVDSSFSIKETDLAMVADIGTLQRLPHLIGDMQTRELALTGRTFSGSEAQSLGLVLKTFPNADAMMNEVEKVAKLIAAKSPLTIRGIKKTLLYRRDHNTADSLQQINTHNSATLYSNDLLCAIQASFTKSKPTFKEP